MIDHAEVMRKFGVNLRQLISIKGCTHTEIAKLLDVSSSSIGVWAAGKGYPSMKNAIELADRFGVTLSELLGEVKAESFDNTTIHTELKIDEVTHMRELHHSGVIDDEVYYLWLEKTILKAAKL